MKQKDLHKFSKIDLYKRMAKLEENIRNNVRTGKLTEHSTAKMKAEYMKIKHYIYECKFCADAEVETILDIDGNEIELLKRDCQSQKCKYHKEFCDLWNGKTIDIGKLLVAALK